MKKEELSFFNLFYIFILGSIFGYFIEVLWSYYRFRIFINHTAVVIGPFNLVYGLTAVALSLVLYKYKKDNIIKIFLLSFITGSVLEYMVSFGMEKLIGFTAWNYSRYFLNINGRICLKYSIFWGLLGIVWIKSIFPYFIKIINIIPKKKGKILIKVLSIFLILDMALTFIAVYRAKEAERGIKPSNKFEEILDDTFNKDYLNNMYNNRWNKK